jgi:hypothetical protein
MNPRQATKYMYWYGEKMEAGDTPTKEEVAHFKEAKTVSIATVKKYMRLDPEDWKYTPGEPFIW